MLSQFSKWLVFVSSFEILFFLLTLKMLGVIPRKEETIFETWKAHFSENKYAIIILLSLTVISLFWMGYLTRWKNNTRFTEKLKGNHSFEMAIFFVAYVVSMCTIDIDRFGAIVNVVLFFILGIAFVSSDFIRFSPAFLIRGYRIYSSDSGYLLARKSLDYLNILIDEHPSGIQVREIWRNTYIMLDA